ncbi:MAG: hypothetical protein A3G34_14360 [Candidatus Lindowbacteria bacterium RIFCSPLOWO2_12_FULL_62_27]|nr:MAG: hypothetical protein A3I06_16835 [Candidatus Lindowbacteria bacterium RIFCSPLOWO2_02_FULL_62_12]OGH62744.1 MAG: hypothetical protein A3G34_14360 [Candidatus Lindowbacteria bacterium RIFCSPLOWO2_12_FULL_62_27]
MTGAADTVKSFIARALKIDESAVHESLQLGAIPQWDSFGHINLMMALEAEYGVPITEQTVLQHVSYAAIAASLAALKR